MKSLFWHMDAGSLDGHLEDVSEVPLQWEPSTTDSVRSGIPFNLTHLLRHAVLLSVMHSVFILCWCDDWFLFDLPDWIIPCWCRQELCSACGGGSLRRLVREQRRVAKLTSWCHILSIRLRSRMIRCLSFPSISWNRGTNCLSRLLQSALIFSSIPRELLHVYVFVLQLSQPHLFKFSAFLSPSRKKSNLHTHLMCDTLASQLDSRSQWINVHHHYPWCETALFVAHPFISSNHLIWFLPAVRVRWRQQTRQTSRRLFHLLDSQNCW